MLTILNEGYLKIIKLFYEDKNSKKHLREIARQTNLQLPSTSRFLKKMEKEQILKSEKDGNMKKYFIRKKDKTYLLFQILDMKNFEKLPLIKQEAIKTYLEVLQEKPVYVLLFGSTAKKNYRKNSDIDLLLITNTKINTTEAEKETNILTTQIISSFQITYSEFIIELKLKEDKVIQSALNTGYPLINHIQYYKEIYNERIRPSKIPKKQ
ncbi:MAG: nucleotidyltransferase domain-containing protein [Candidatus Woesearchaeota archaeon]